MPPPPRTPAKTYAAVVAELDRRLRQAERNLGLSRKPQAN
jgi:hypothetical protein